MEATATSRAGLPRLDLVEIELAKRAERQLSRFVKQAWKLVEPETPLIWNWHHDIICEHLEAVTAGQIKDLLINVPPGHTKSRIVSVMWPAWMWVHKPSHQFLCSSYSGDLAKRDSIYCRQVIQSRWYQQWWSDRFSISGDMNLKTRFGNNRGGHRIAISVGGGATGERGDTIICDDPHNLKYIHSKLVREEARRWWKQVMPSRRNNPETASRVIIMQRGHYADLAGEVIKDGGYTELVLQAEQESKSVITYPRTGRVQSRKDGDLLWPERFNAKVLGELREELGPYAYAAQYQQTPVPEGGGIIKAEWWKHYDQLPNITSVIHSWDTAFKAKQDNDFSACVTVGEFAGRYYIIDVFKKRMEYPELREKCQAIDKAYPNTTATLIEDHASGQSLVQDMKQLHGMTVLPVRADTDKVSRVHAVTALIEAGKVWIPRKAHWIAEFVRECTEFPYSEHDDQVDALSQALGWLQKRTRTTFERATEFRRV